MKKQVYSFGGGTADGDGKMKDVLGGKGAGLAEMSPGRVCRCRPASPSPPKSAIFTSRTTTRFPTRSKSRWSHALEDLEKRDGPEARRCRRPAAGQRPIRRQVLHAGHDGHDPQPRPERRDRRWPGHQERQPALRLRLLPPLHPDVRRSGARNRKARISTKYSTRAKKKVKAKLDTDLTAEDLQAVIADYKKLVKKKTGKPFPQDAMRAACRSLATPYSVPGSTPTRHTTAR